MNFSPFYGTGNMVTNPPPNGPWSMLLEELLQSILYRLRLADHIRFGAVCKRWRAIAVENSAANKPFSLVRTARPEHLIYRLLSSFDGRQWVHARFYGGIKGWLVLRLGYKKIQTELGSVERRCQLILLNPGSRMAPILLPLMRSWRGSIQKVVLSSPPDESTTEKCMVVFKGSCGNMGFYRFGDSDWTMTPVGFGEVRDLLFYKEQLYVIDRNGLLKVFEFGLTSAPTNCLTFPPCLDCHLVISSDRLLLFHITYPNRTCRFRELPDKSRPYFSKAFEIDLKGIPSYVEMERLCDDKILFLSPACSLCIPARENPEFMPNCVYMDTDSYWNFYSASLGKKTFEYVHKTRSSFHKTRSSVFFHLFRGDGFKKMDEPKYGCSLSGHRQLYILGSQNKYASLIINARLGA